jgi:hypothetical protein
MRLSCAIGRTIFDRNKNTSQMCDHGTTQHHDQYDIRNNGRMIRKQVTIGSLVCHTSHHRRIDRAICRAQLRSHF